MNDFIERQRQRGLAVTETVGGHLRRLPGAVLLEETWRAFSEDRASVLAAALSYYTILSLFPLMLFIIAVSSPFLQSESAVRAVSAFISSYVPQSATLVHASLEEVTRVRGPLTLFATVGFLWSASGVFDLIQLGLNRAFCVNRLRPVWRQRIVSLFMVIGTTLLFGVSLLTTTFIRLAVHYRLVLRNDAVLEYAPIVSTFLLSVIVFGMLYRYVPYDSNIHWRDIWQVAIVAALLWEAAKIGFVWYLTNLTVLSLVYGSVGAIIAIMLWGYISAMILLLGGEMAAVLSGARKRFSAPPAWWSPMERVSSPMLKDSDQVGQEA